MGTIQNSLNNLLMTTSIAGGTFKAIASQNAKTKAMEAAKPTEEQEIKAATDKLREATDMAIGYSEKQAVAKTAEQELGDVIGKRNEKKPRGVGQKTFDRRQANAQTMQVILQKAAQNKDFRDRIAKFSRSELAAALKPTIDEKKKGGKK